MTNFVNVIRSLIQFEPGERATLDKVMGNLLNRFESDTVTIHLLDPERNVLRLKAARGVPPQVLEVVREIPIGKGIAGECARTAQPVTTCNLQTDDSGVARPAAKQTGVGGALCVPMIVDGRVAGTLGVGTKREHEFGAEQTRLLAQVARAIGEELTRSPQPA